MSWELITQDGSGKRQCCWCLVRCLSTRICPYSSGSWPRHWRHKQVGLPTRHRHKLLCYLVRKAQLCCGRLCRWVFVLFPILLHGQLLISPWSIQMWYVSEPFLCTCLAVFNYVATQHNVQVVTANEYRSCAQSNGQTYMTGKDSIPLTTAGKYYFICSVISHCEMGMKIMIDVKAAAAAPPPATTTPPTMSPLPPTEAPAAAPVLPPPPSTATSVPACLSLVAVMAASAFGVLFLC